MKSTKAANVDHYSYTNNKARRQKRFKMKQRHSNKGGSKRRYQEEQYAW